ncbi:MAG: AsmA family protein [Pseudomonadota bacterium]|nr:AsmA family protein [Pseudomonadota bacterium]
MTRRRAIVWIALAALLLMIPLSLRWLGQPERVAGVILDELGDSLGLEITAGGDSGYRLRGTPQLVVRDVDVRQPGADTPLLRAERVLLSLPWSTIRARGAELSAQRLEIDAPQLDLQALERWRETRPPAAEPRVPTLQNGLRIVRGRVIASGWTLEGLELALPSLAPAEPVTAAASGRLQAGTTAVPFDLRIALTRPAFDAGLGAAGTASIVTPGWRLPMRLKLGGRLHEGEDGWGLDRFKLGAHARHVDGDTQTQFVYGLAGRLRYRDGRLAIAPLGLVVRGQDSIPTLDSQGAFAWQQDVALDLDGTMPGWPDAWPAVPPPIGQSDSALPFALRYRGPLNLSGDTALQLRRDATRFDARFRLPDVLVWIDAAASGTPLPPIDGRLTTPRLEIAGATLHGVDIQFDDEAGDE